MTESADRDNTGRVEIHMIPSRGNCCACRRRFLLTQSFSEILLCSKTSDLVNLCLVKCVTCEEFLGDFQRSEVKFGAQYLEQLVGLT